MIQKNLNSSQLFSNLLKTKNPDFHRDFFVGLLGLEPRTTGPKPAVLPITP